jgi:hypothetical protein
MYPRLGEGGPLNRSALPVIVRPHHARSPIRVKHKSQVPTAAWHAQHSHRERAARHRNPLRRMEESVLRVLRQAQREVPR